MATFLNESNVKFIEQSCNKRNPNFYYKVYKYQPIDSFMNQYYRLHTASFPAQSSRCDFFSSISQLKL
jgi:hypothetical protein